MIEAVIKKHKQSIVQITVSGHAQSAEYGKDLVCAGVSTACIGIANALVHYQFLSQELGTIEINDGYIDIKVQHPDVYILKLSKLLQLHQILLMLKQFVMMVYQIYLVNLIQSVERP